MVRTERLANKNIESFIIAEMKHTIQRYVDTKIHRYKHTDEIKHDGYNCLHITTTLSSVTSLPRHIKQHHMYYNSCSIKTTLHAAECPVA